MKVRNRISLKPPKLGPRLQRAFRYAAEKHYGQTRKQSAVPYLSHLMAVASLVLEAGGDEDMAIAALLHDVVEDCGGMPRLREIRKQFGRAGGEDCGGLHGFIRRAEAGVGGTEEGLPARGETRRGGDAVGFGVRQAA